MIPEVVQTSSLDCGPAALKSLLEGFGQPVSYGRLREACQTGLDGTAIETIENVANQLGLEAEQIMLPLDHLLLPEAGALPAIVVVVLAQGLTHFVVVWRRIGNWLQIMDPAVGRRWVSAKAFLNDVYVHSIRVAAGDWQEYIATADFELTFRARRRAIGMTELTYSRGERRQTAAADAAVRLTQSLISQGIVSKGRVARGLANRFRGEPHLIPDRYWPVTDDGVDEAGVPQVLMRGAVLVRIKGKRHAMAPLLDKELAAAITEKPPRPAFELARVLLKSGGVTWPLLLTAIFAAAAGAFLEALLFRGLLDVNASLAFAGQRLGAAVAVVLFCLALLLLEWPSFATGARLGRILENRFRIALLEKLPRLSDRYFQSRPVSDMAERSHIMHRLRHLPDQLRQLIAALLQLAVTAAGVVWLDVAAWPFMLALLGAALIPLFGAHWLLEERDLRVRTHAGGLMRFYLDAMLGLMPIRTHGAGGSLRRQHGNLLNEWMAAGIRLQRAAVSMEGLQVSVMFSLVAGFLLLRTFTGAEVGRVLLIAYWTLNMPALGQQIATLVRQYPNYRSITLRLLEPLTAPEEEAFKSLDPLLAPPAIQLENVTVIASGNPILADLTVQFEAGSHVAIVGPSGAGKSSIVGLLLGWLRPTTGVIRVNGGPLDVQQLRLGAAWVDPAVQLWNRSFQANLLYGGEARPDLAGIVDRAALRHVLGKLPDGMQTFLGENGGLVSGGEGQRVRFGRALNRREAKLVILDEPFRGLDRDKRRELLAEARRYWASATLICITHDLAETKAFDRVMVIEDGRIIEHDSPKHLALNPESRYARLLAAERDAYANFWESAGWRRIRLSSGRLVEARSKPVNTGLRESVVA